MSLSPVLMFDLTVLISSRKFLNLLYFSYLFKLLMKLFILMQQCPLYLKLSCVLPTFVTRISKGWFWIAFANHIILHPISTDILCSYIKMLWNFLLMYITLSYTYYKFPSCYFHICMKYFDHIFPLKYSFIRSHKWN
jgi:hypothetical protein